MTSVPTTKPPLGFRDWIDPYGMQKERPYDYEIVEVWMEPWRRPDAAERQMLKPSDLHPAFNIAGLWWRPIKHFGELEN